LAIGAVVVFVWRGPPLGGPPARGGVSGRGQVRGAVAGLVAAWVFAREFAAAGL
jgi:hypothetical protein